jgi:hypothetical protein
MVRLLAVATFVFAAGCVDNAGDGALRLIHNEVVEDACVVTGMLSAASRSGGRIEASSPVDYVLTPLVQNFATSAGGKLTAQRTAFLEGARIDLTFAKADLFTAAELADLGTQGLLKFASPFSASVNPDNGTAGVGFSVVPAELLKAILPKLAGLGSTVVNVRLKVYGKMGGGDVESEPYFYPVTVCDHNLAPCVIASTFTCGATGIMVRKGNGCNPFQDGPVDCCTAAGSLICPGRTGTAVQ